MAKRYVQGIDKIIQERVDIVDVISRYMKLKRSGRNYKGLCPFHHEKTPSFFVSSEEQLYNCFGCDAGGSVITFVSEMENLGFIDTIEYLAEIAHIDLTEFMENSEEYSTEYKKRDEIIKMNREAAIYFYRLLGNNKKALNYLSQRKINKNIIKTFGLGYVLDEWNGLMDYLKTKGYSQELMLKAGLVSKSSKGTYYDKFRGRVMFPIFNVKGKIIAFGGRIIEKNDQAPKYLNSPETMVFNKSKTLYGLNIARKHLRDSKQMILVEGYMDVIMLHKYGIKNAVATLGTSFTKEHSRIIKKYVDELIICFDSDEAGIKATKRAINNAKGIIKKVRVIQLDTGYDPDDYVNENGQDAFHKLIETAKTSHQFLLEDMSKGLNLSDEYDLQEYIENAKKILKDIEDFPRQSYYAEKISEKVNISKNRLIKTLFPNEGISKKVTTRKATNSDEINDKIMAGHLGTIEKKLLQFALLDQKYYDAIVKKIAIQDLNFDVIKEIFRYLERSYAQGLPFNLDRSMEGLSLKALKLCKSLLKTSALDKGLDRDLEIYIKKFEIECLKEELRQLQIQRKKALSDGRFEEMIIKEEKLKRVIKSKKSHLGN